MPKMIFVNLPITQLARSTAFYAALGATKNPKSSEETSTCMVFSATIYAMLLTHEKYRHFTSRPIADARATSSALIALSFDSRDEVNVTIDRAVAAGGASRPQSRPGIRLYVRPLGARPGRARLGDFLDGPRGRGWRLSRVRSKS